jgi:iron complex outermembrane receptor protein
VLLAFAAAAGRARAGEQRLGEVVVTAPPAPEEAAERDPTAFATVVDTRSTPARVETLAEALAETVGVQVRHFGGLGDFSTISVRGSSAGQVQVYLDGVPLSRAESDAVNLADLPLDAVERVEVYRGTTPLAFAQSGPGGIVNVVPRRPGDAPLTGASLSYGSFDTRKVDLVRSARVGTWEYLGFAHYLGSAGDFTFLNDLGTTANPGDDRLETRRNNGFDLGNLTGRLGWRPDGPLTAALTTDTFVRDEGVPGVGSVQALDTSLRTVRQLAHLDAKLTSPRGLPLDAAASTYVVWERDRFRDPRGEISLTPTDTRNESTASGGQVLVRSAVGAHHVPGALAAIGHERFAERDELDPRPAPPDRTRLRGTLAAQDEMVAWRDRISVVPGLRWEIFRDDFPGEAGIPAPLRAGGTTVRDFLSPRLGVRVTPLAPLTLLGNVGRWAREPNLSELFGSRGVVVGNPRLRPEKALNGDLGCRLAVPAVGPLSGASLEYAWFHNDVDDLIVLVQNSQNIVRPENVTSASVRGHEVAARAQLWRRVGLAANYTHQRARDDGDVSFLRGKQLPGRPADEAFAHVDLRWSAARPLPLAPGWLWPGRVFYEVNVIADNFLDRANVRRVDSRLLHDAGVELRLPLPGVGLTLEGKNLGDDRTRDVLGFPVPGRSFFLTFTWGLGRREDDDAAR